MAIINPEVAVRHATSNDTEWLITALKKFTNDLGRTKEFLNEPHWHQALEICMRDHLLLVAESSAGRLGLMAGCNVPHPFNPHLKTLMIFVWWVDDVPGKGRISLQMMDEFIRYGKAHSNWIVFALTNERPIGEKALLRRGFKYYERSYLLEV